MTAYPSISEVDALRESEEKYRTLFNSIDAGVCTIQVLFNDEGVGVDYLFIESNPAFIQQTGLSNTTGKNMRSIAPTHEPFWYEVYGQIALSGQPMRFEHEAAALNKYFEVFAFPIGRPGDHQLAVIFSDISARKLTDKRLTESEERFRMFVTASSEIVYRMSGDWEQMYSLQGKGILSDTLDPITSWLEKYIPDSEKSRVQNAIDNAIRRKTLFQLEHRVIQADGSIGWTFSRAIPFLNDAGQIQEWFGAASDITERKQREANLAFLAEINADLARLTNIGETMNHIGARLGQYFGLSMCLFVEVDEAGEYGVINYGWNRKDGPGVSGPYPLQDVIAQGFHKRMRDEETVTVRNAATHNLTDPRQLAGNKVGSFVLVPIVTESLWRFFIGAYMDAPYDWKPDQQELLQEITARIWTRLIRARAEEGILRSEQELKALLKVREDFISIASHELKTPVTSIKVFAELIAEQLAGKGETVMTATMGKLNSQIDRLMHLISDLLDTGKLEEGQLVTAKETIEINAFISERIEEFKRTAPNRKISLDLDGPAIILGDRERLAQVLLNLLSNAIKYSRADTEIIIRGRHNGKEVSVSVIDQGIGIPASATHMIFDRFYRVGGHAMSTYPGMGLGLYISAEIIRQHGGSISVNSKEGAGTEFVFRLPVKQ